MALLDSIGALVVEYKCDAWGKSIAVSGNLADNLGRRDPFRYRGYVCDEETGLHYLRSWYYNSNVGRFVNADGVLNSGLLSVNMYAYCANLYVLNGDTMKKRIICLFVAISIFVANVNAAIGEGERAMGLWESFKNHLYNCAVEHFLEKRGILIDDVEAYEYANDFLSATLDHDVAAMKALFAPNAVSEIGENALDEMLTNFVDYFQENSFTLESPIGPSTSEYRDHGLQSKELKGPLEVDAGENKYRIAIRCVSCDDWVQDNIGIWSIYIIEKSKDSNQERPYYGDLKFTTGIFFDVPRLR